MNHIRGPVWKQPVGVFAGDLSQVKLGFLDQGTYRGWAQLGLDKGTRGGDSTFKLLLDCGFQEKPCSSKRARATGTIVCWCSIVSLGRTRDIFQNARVKTAKFCQRCPLGKRL